MEKSSQKCSSPSISEQMNELSGIVERLENPEIELEDAIQLHEQGMKLSNSIQKKLESAEQRVAKVSADGFTIEQDTPKSISKK